jgi:hypothetical protein
LTLDSDKFLESWEINYALIPLIEG